MGLKTKYNLSKENCWSCEYYCAERKLKNHWFDEGKDVSVSEEGVCLKKNTNKNHNDWCLKYKRWSVIEGLLSKKKINNEVKYQNNQIIKQTANQKKDAAIKNSEIDNDNLESDRIKKEVNLNLKIKELSFRYDRDYERIIKKDKQYNNKLWMITILILLVPAIFLIHYGLKLNQVNEVIAYRYQILNLISPSDSAYQEIELLLQNSINEKQELTVVFIIIFVLSLLVLSITIFVRNNLSRKKRKEINKELEELNRIYLEKKNNLIIKNK